VSIRYQKDRQKIRWILSSHYEKRIEITDGSH
jgi:hypothetical protein